MAPSTHAIRSLWSYGTKRNQTPEHATAKWQHRRERQAAVANQRAAMALQTLRRLRLASRRIERFQAGAVHALHARKSHERLGFMRFGDFAREALQLEARTARRRVSLHEALVKFPEVEAAYLRGDVGTSQVLALAGVLDETNQRAWLRLAERTPVRTLRKVVKDALAYDPAKEEEGSGLSEPWVEVRADDEEDDENRMRISFLAPQVPALALEHGFEVAQRVLGWEAPRDECLGAMLSEASSSWGSDTTEDADPEPHVTSRPDVAVGGRLPWAHDPYEDIRFWREKAQMQEALRAGWKRGGVTRTRKRRSPKRAEEPLVVPHRRRVLKQTSRCLNRSRRAVERVERWTMPAIGERTAPRQLLDRYVALQAMERSLIVYQARLVFLLDSFGGAERVGFRDTGEAVAAMLRVSERTAWTLCDLGWRFQHAHALADAYVRGSFGIGQFLLASWATGWGRFSMGSGVKDWRVDDWLSRSQEVTLRQFRKEVRFVVRLARYDDSLLQKRMLTPPDLERKLCTRLFRFGWSQEGLERELCDRGLALPEGCSRDPAENPVVLARLEALLDLLILGADALSDADEAVRYRKTLSGPGRQMRVTVMARPPIYEQWERTCAGIQAQTGRLPAWALAVLIAQHALGEWERHDPERLPTERKILERDGYRCQVPGCSSRRGLEAHHVIYRSHHGPDDPWNLTAVCAAHHHHGIHKGRIRVTGKAPHDLVWELGCLGGPAPRWIFRGEKRVRPSNVRDRLALAAAHEAKAAESWLVTQDPNSMRLQA